MTVRFKTVRLEKLYPLQISRGTSTGSSNLFVEVEDSGQTGLGECAPGTGFDDSLAQSAQADLERLLAGLDLSLGPHAVWAEATKRGVDSAALAALDIALWDLLAKQAGMALHRVLGLPLPTTPTSVTIGINPPEVIFERVPEILSRTGAKALKVKLGNPLGVDADKECFLAARRAAGESVQVRVDANGGWSPSDARKMIAWLHDSGCDYVEQPLPAGEEDRLPEVFRSSPLPIFLDESVRTSADVPKVADRCHGVNLKLMKTGGLTEALRLVATARAHGLRTMIGCMGESSVAISAGASIGALFDSIDLDSHLNLNPDPAVGALMCDGVVRPSGLPGHGASLR